MEVHMTVRRLVLFGAVLAFVLAACSAGANPETGVAAADGDVAGFWMGLWHGLIAPITFVISLFKDTVNVYDVHNNGNWYDFGFVFGLSIAFGGSCRGAKRRR
jgi:hypothetical protein